MRNRRQYIGSHGSGARRGGARADIDRNERSVALYPAGVYAERCQEARNPVGGDLGNIEPERLSLSLHRQSHVLSPVASELAADAAGSHRFMEGAGSHLECVLRAGTA